MVTAQIPGSKHFDTQMSVHTSIQNTNVILAQEFQKPLSNESRKHGILDFGKKQKSSSKVKKQTEIIMYNIIKILSIVT